MSRGAASLSPPGGAARHGGGALRAQAPGDRAGTEAPVTTPRLLLRTARTVLGLLFRRPILSVSAIPILPDGRIILARRQDDGLWSLPGGIVDWGETVEACARRELREEIDVTLVVVDRLVGVYSDPARDPRVHAAAVALAVQVEGAPRAADLTEITEVKIVTLDEIDLTALSHDHGRHLADYRDGKTAIA